MFVWYVRHAIATNGLYIPDFKTKMRGPVCFHETRSIHGFLHFENKSRGINLLGFCTLYYLLCSRMILYGLIAHCPYFLYYAILVSFIMWNFWLWWKAFDFDQIHIAQKNNKRLLTVKQLNHEAPYKKILKDEFTLDGRSTPCWTKALLLLDKLRLILIIISTR